PPDLSPTHTGVFQYMLKGECHFINGTERVRFVVRLIYNRQQFVHFYSDVGHYVRDPSYGEKQARYCNSAPELMEYTRGDVETYCRHNYELFTPFSMEG
ncbi:HB2L protein, partial [Oreocharis arfaki]|nr:HB2L protein [Oreocharis arfaki]